MKTSRNNIIIIKKGDTASSTVKGCTNRTGCWDEIIQMRNDGTGCLHPPDDAVYFYGFGNRVFETLDKGSFSCLFYIG